MGNSAPGTTLNMHNQILNKVEKRKYKTVAVLMGGWSAEGAVSFVSGKACARALRECGYEVREIEVGRDLRKLIEDLGTHPDVVFNALHGKGGEDGCIQGVLDMLGLRYTHSGRTPSAIAMDKTRSKDVVKRVGVPSPEGVILSAEDIRAGNIPFKPPYVIKPNAEGSSVGVYIVREGDNRMAEILGNWQYDDALVEKYIPGRELTVTSVSKEGQQATSLTVTEIKSHLDFYDYEAKYEDGGSSHTLPAQIPTEVFDAAMDWAAKAHDALGCDGISRSDFRYDDSQTGIQGLYYLETNTQPGMTPTSLVPEQAEYVGLSFNDLVEWMVENALCHEEKLENPNLPDQIIHGLKAV